MAVYFAAVSAGLGDLIVCLPAIQWLVANGEETYVVTRSERQVGVAERIEGISGEVKEVEFDPGALPPGDRFINLRDHPLQKNWVWGSPEFESVYGKLKITQIVELLSRDMGVPADFQRLTPLQYKQKQDLRDAVAFVPGSDGFVKHWPLSHWLSIFAHLNNSGRRAIVLGQKDQSPWVREVINAGVPWYETPTIADAIDAVSSCRALVTVDTGLMHIAVHQGKSTIAFFNREGLYMRREPNCHRILSAACHPDCQAEFSIDANLHAISFGDALIKCDQRVCPVPVEQSCMGSIRSEQVIAKLDEILSTDGVVLDYATG